MRASRFRIDRYANALSELTTDKQCTCELMPQTELHENKHEKIEMRRSLIVALGFATLGALSVTQPLFAASAQLNHPAPAPATYGKKSMVVGRTAVSPMVVRSPAVAVRPPAVAVRSPAVAVRSPAGAVRSPAVAVRSPAVAVPSPAGAVPPKAGLSLAKTGTLPMAARVAEPTLPNSKLSKSQQAPASGAGETPTFVSRRPEPNSRCRPAPGVLFCDQLPFSP